MVYVELDTANSTFKINIQNFPWISLTKNQLILPVKAKRS